MAPGRERVQRLTVAEEHRGLTVLDQAARAHLEVRHPLLGHALDHPATAAAVFPLQNFKSDTHRVLPVLSLAP